MDLRVYPAVDHSEWIVCFCDSTGSGFLCTPIVRLSLLQLGEWRRAILDLSAGEEVESPADHLAVFPGLHAVSLKNCGNLGGEYVGRQ